MGVRATTRIFFFSLAALVLAACGGGSDNNDGGVVGGGLPSGGSPTNKNRAPSISGVVPAGNETESFSFTPQVSDPDGDALQVSVANLPAWLSYNSSSYTISGTPGSADLGPSPEIVYTVSDGSESASMRFRIQVAYNNLKQALRSGDHRYVNDPNDYIDNALNTLAQVQTESQTLKAQLFNLPFNGQLKSAGSSLTDLDWNPTHDAGHLKATFGVNHELLVSNAVTEASYDVYQRIFGIGGEKAGQHRNARFLALGSNPMRNSYRDADSLNDDMHALLENAMVWLAGRSDFSTSPLNVVIAQMEQGYYFPDQVANRQWLDDHYPNQVRYNSAESCDGNSLNACLSDDVDLLLVSQVSDNEALNPNIESAVANWLAAGKSVLYVHNDGDLTDLGGRLLKLLDVSYEGDNYWWRLALDGYDINQFASAAPADIQLIADLLQRFKDQSFSIDMAACENHSCPPESGFDEQFQNAASALRSMFRGFDESKTRLFDDALYDFQKSVLLLTDHYRQQASFPMDKSDTPLLAFLQSFFADHAVYNSRDLNPAQADMGNFSRSDFSHITPVDRQVTLTSKRYFRPAGVYALPGQTITVTRTDTSAVNTTVFINTLRDGATHQFNNNAYSRPKYLRTASMPIAPGETLQLTSSYGGPVQIGFDSNDQQVAFSFQNIGEHPYWGGSQDDARFDAALTAGEYDWAELATSGFVVHSKLDKMRVSVDGPNWDDAAGLAAATARYMSNFPHVLAGFQGPGIDVVPEIHNFASSNGWQIETIDLVKHMNADQATCGYGCSGNPYDAYWSYGPVAHGDLHELGHGLEQGRFRFAGWDGHASTNPYSYYSKSQFFKDTDLPADCQSLPFAELKQTLMDSRTKADPFAEMQAADLTGWSEGVAIYVQMMMAAQAEGVLQDGWHLLARLHVLLREFRRADDDDESWLAGRSNLGFSQFSREDAIALSNNDWLSIALSKVLGRDMRDFLAMWGLAVGSEASAQIASLNYASMPKRFFDSTADGYCENMAPSALTVN